MQAIKTVDVGVAHWGPGGDLRRGPWPAKPPPPEALEFKLFVKLILCYP